MPLSQNTAIVTWQGLGTYSQSRAHEEPRLDGELPDAYDKRTWRSHLFVVDGVVHLPRGGVHQAVFGAGKYSKEKIPGQGNATWTAKLTSGLVLIDDPVLLNGSGKPATPEDFSFEDIYSNSDGVRGSGKRVMRRFPVIYQWSACFTVNIIDPIITQSIFEDMIERAGLFIGLGRWRPEKSGQNGRFKMTDCIWQAVQEFKNAA